MFDGGDWIRFGGYNLLEMTEKATYSLIAVAKLNWQQFQTRCLSSTDPWMGVTPSEAFKTNADFINSRKYERRTACQR